MTERAECRCEKCRAACERVPGLFTPDEALAAMSAGLAGRIMVVGFPMGERMHFAVSPLSVPGRDEPTALSAQVRLDTTAAKGRCTFLTVDGLCEIHATKPQECAVALPCRAEGDRPASNASIRALWASREGQRVVAEWKRSIAQ